MGDLEANGVVLGTGGVKKDRQPVYILSLLELWWETTVTHRSGRSNAKGHQCSQQRVLKDEAPEPGLQRGHIR